MKLLPVLSAALLCLSADPTVFAQEAAVKVDSSARDAAERLFESTDMESMLTASLDASIDMQMQQMAQLGLSADGMAKMKTEMMSFFEEIMSWDSLKEEFYQIYTEAFTIEELTAIADFYETPAGRKALELTPSLMQKGMMIGQQRVQGNQAALEAKIMPIIEAEKAK